MKTGMTLDQLDVEVRRQSELKDDLVFDTREITLLNGTELHVPVPDGPTDYAVSHTAHRQIASRLGIPAKFYDRLRDDGLGSLLDQNVNTLFRHDGGERRLLRTFRGDDPIVRAFLSDRYRMRDNDELLAKMMPILKGLGMGAKVMSSGITDTRFYLKVCTPKLESAVEVGDIVRGGVIVQNSEVGHGSLSIQPWIYRLICKNGMTAGTKIGSGRRFAHLGGTIEQDEDYRVFSDATLQLDDEAFFAKVADVVKAAVDETTFELLVSQMRDARATPKFKPLESMERLTKRFQFTEDEQNKVIEHLVEDNDLSAYGVMNAVTRTATDVFSYDRSTELEAVGGSILQLAQTPEWEAICA